MIRTRKITPRVLSHMSRDFQLLLTLTDLAFNSLELDIKYFTDLVDPNRCKSTWLPALASLVGYTYDESLSPDQNRFIISNYRSLINKRGSIDGIELAVATYLKLIGRTDTSFSVTIPTESNEEAGMIEGRIYIDDEFLDISTIPLLQKLLKLVRPVGVNYIIRKATTATYNTNICAESLGIIYQFNYPIDFNYLPTDKGVIIENDRRYVKDNADGITDADNLRWSKDHKKLMIHPGDVVGHSLVASLDKDGNPNDSENNAEVKENANSKIEGDKNE